MPIKSRKKTIKRNKNRSKNRSKKRINKFSSILFSQKFPIELFNAIDYQLRKMFDKSHNTVPNISAFKELAHLKKLSKSVIYDSRVKSAENVYNTNSSFIGNLYINSDISITNMSFNNTIGTVKFIGYDFKNDSLIKRKNGISVGTWVNNNDCKSSLVNIYKTILDINGTVIESIRLGTVPTCTKNTDIVKALRLLEPNKKIINFSLISHCTGACKTASAILGHGSLKKIKNALIYEPIITNTEEHLYDKNFYTIFLPLSRNRDYKVVKINTPKDTKKENDENCTNNKCDKRIKEMLSLIDYEHLYESIIKIFIYYFLFLRYEFTVNLHCVSAKDRSSVFDSLFKSVMTCMIILGPKMKKGVSLEEGIDVIYNQIILFVERWFIEYLKIGLVITYYSTGLFGLKLKDIVIANDIKRILGQELFDDFGGFAHYLN